MPAPYFRPGSTGGWDGILEHVQLDLLPIEMLEVLDIDGTLDATVDLHRTAPEAGGGLVGHVDFDLRDGTLSTGLQVALPFERLHGRLDFGGEKYVTVNGVELTGSLLDATIQGDVAYAEAPGAQRTVRAGNHHRARRRAATRRFDSGPARFGFRTRRFG